MDASNAVKQTYRAEQNYLKQAKRSQKWSTMLRFLWVFMFLLVWFFFLWYKNRVNIATFGFQKGFTLALALKLPFLSPLLYPDSKDPLTYAQVLNVLTSLLGDPHTFLEFEQPDYLYCIPPDPQDNCTQGAALEACAQNCSNCYEQAAERVAGGESFCDVLISMGAIRTKSNVNNLVDVFDFGCQVMSVAASFIVPNPGTLLTIMNVGMAGMTAVTGYTTFSEFAPDTGMKFKGMEMSSQNFCSFCPNYQGCPTDFGCDENGNCVEGKGNLTSGCEGTCVPKNPPSPYTIYFVIGGLIVAVFILHMAIAVSRKKN